MRVMTKRLTGVEDFILRHPEEAVATGGVRIEIFDALNVALGFAVDIRGQLMSLRFALFARGP